MCKAIYRPASFFKGFIFPFLETKDPILKQAEIIGSMIAKRSFPNTHGAAALFYCCDSIYSGIMNIIFKTLIDKKFCLPKTVIDKIFEFFVNFDKRPNIKKPLPLLWYQTLASFVKNYGGLVKRTFESEPETRTSNSRKI